MDTRHIIKREELKRASKEEKNIKRDIGIIHLLYLFPNEINALTSTALI